jgi:hypothetical protein
MQIAVNFEDFVTAKSKDEIDCVRSILKLCEEHLNKGDTLVVLSTILMGSITWKLVLPMSRSWIRG